MFESLFCKGKLPIRITDSARISRDGHMHIKRRLILRFIIIKNVLMAAYLLHSSSLCVFIITNSCVHNFINALATMISFKRLNKKYILKYLTKLSSKHGIIKCNIALLIIMRYIF